MIDWNKPVQTRDGQSVEIVSMKGRGEFPVLGYIGAEKAEYTYRPEDLDAWRDGGIYWGDGKMMHLDLVNVPEL